MQERQAALLNGDAEDDVDEGFSFMAPPAGLECNDEDECVMPEDMYDDVE